jgi:spermidine synthase
VIVYVNGIGQSWIPYGGVHTALGAVPAFMHPDPRDAAVIGLGSGDTVFGLAARRTLERITSVEIVRPQLETLRRLLTLASYDGLNAVLSDQRIEHIYGDGRLYLMQSARRFDIIEADALRPTSAYAGHLYSDAYFRLLRDRLKPGGLAVTWSPTRRVRDTFASVFPYILVFGEIAIGSSEPIPFDLEAIAPRVADPGVQAYFRRAGIDIAALLTPLMLTPPLAIGPDFDRTSLVDLNTDLFPRDEFAVPPAGHR